MTITLDVSPAVHRRAGLGRYAESLTRALVAADPARCRAYGQNGRRFVEQRYSRQAQARRLATLLEGLNV
jgi:ABC-type Zn uptake system ZnuABC Zn-binding protein ZnuA